MGLLKIDFEKAYDSLSWDYLFQVMQFLVFGEKWWGWILTCF